MNSEDVYSESEEECQTYAEAFPPLSLISMDHNESTTGISESIKPIPASTGTHVFHVAAVERKHVSPESSKAAHIGILQNIIDVTGCTIEMNESKDQGVTFVVRGRLSNFNRARRLILSRFAKQLTTEIEIP